jgi:hypothetical protein
MKKFTFFVLLVGLLSCDRTSLNENVTKSDSEIGKEISSIVSPSGPSTITPTVAEKSSLGCSSPGSVNNTIDLSLPTTTLSSWFDYGSSVPPPSIRVPTTFDYVKLALSNYYGIDISQIYFQRREGLCCGFIGEKYIYMRESDYWNNGSIKYVASAEETTIFLQRIIKHINDKVPSNKRVREIYFDHLSYLCDDNHNYSGVSINAYAQ